MVTRVSLIGMIALALAAPLRADEVRDRDEANLREAKLSLDGPTLLRFFHDRTPTEEQRKEMQALIAQLGDESFRVRRKAASKLESFGLPVIGILKQGLKSPDPEIARQCAASLSKVEKVPTEVVAASVARSLGRLKPAGALDIVLAQLPAVEDEQVADGLRWALAQLAVTDGKPEPKVVAALTAMEPARRAAAAEALVNAKATGVEPEVRKLLKDSDIGVRLRTALALVTVARAKDVVPDLIDQLASGPANQVWQAEEILRHLAEDEGPSASAIGAAADRALARKAWAEWWKAQGAAINLAKLDNVPKSLGYMLVLQMNPNAAESEAKEYAPDGRTVRWSIRNLSLALDAHVLPKSNRVLIAEHNASAVTERDFEGKEHHRWNVTQPVACQRLPNGNTFIAFRNGLVEYNAKDEKVFTFNRANDVVAGRKARDGTYVFLTRNGLCVHINAEGKELKSFRVGQTYYYSSLELLPNNRVLLTLTTGVAEFDLKTGKQEWSALVNRNPTSVQRLPNGNTLICGPVTRSVSEINPQGAVSKSYSLPDGAVPWRVIRR